MGSLQLCAGQFDPIPMVPYAFGLTPSLDKLQIIKWNATILLLLMISQGQGSSIYLVTEGAKCGYYPKASKSFLNAITGSHISFDGEWDLLAFPKKFGGLVFQNVVPAANLKLSN